MHTLRALAAPFIVLGFLSRSASAAPAHVETFSSQAFGSYSLGLSGPNNLGAGGGVRVNYRWQEATEFGVEFHLVSVAPGTLISMNYWSAMARANRFLTRDVYAGLSAGVATLGVSTPFASGSSTGFSFGAQCGYLWKFSEHLSVAPEARVNAAINAAVTGLSTWVSGLVVFGYHY